MEVIFTKILGIAKYTTKFFVVVALGAAFLLFSAESYLEKLGLMKFVADYQQYIGIAFLVSGVVTVTNFILFTYRKVISSISSKQAMKMRQQRLHSLNPMEKKILLYYFVNGTNTQSLPFNDGTVSELAGYRIIQRTANMSQWGTEFPYNLNPWAREYLTKHPGLLKVDEVEIELIQREMERQKFPW